MRHKIILVFVLLFVLLIPIFVMAAKGTSTTLDIWSKFDFGPTANASSSTFTQRFIGGEQPVSQYTTSTYSGRLGILSETYNCAINITSPLNNSEIPRGAPTGIISNEDDLNLVPDALDILSKMYVNGTNSGLSNINTSFYFNGNAITTNLTNKSGIAAASYDKTSLSAGIYSLLTNYSNDYCNKIISDSTINFSLIVYNIPNYAGNKGVATRYVWNQTAILYFNVTKTNVSGTFFYDPANITANATDSAVRHYPEAAYVDGYRLYKRATGQYETRVIINRSLIGAYNPVVRWEIYVSDDNWSSYIASARHSDVDIIDGPICGNGIAETGEECDDGNLVSGDGCSSSCTTGGGGGGGGGGGKPCTNDCSSGETETVCVTQSTLRTRTCGNYDSDSCLEWGGGDYTDCGEGYVCENAQCVVTNCDDYWVCGKWGECADGTQERVCSNSVCDIDDKVETRSCEVCEENWQCQWTECFEENQDSSSITGFSITGEPSKKTKSGDKTKEEDKKNKKEKSSDEVLFPNETLFSPPQDEYTPFTDEYSYAYDCIDLNDCGTEENKPDKVFCEEKPEKKYYKNGELCYPQWNCDSWGTCEADYNIEDVLYGRTSSRGFQKRNCVDRTDCALDKTEKKPCDLAIPIEARKTEWCSEDYVEIYEKETDNLVSRVKETEIAEFVQLSRIDISFITTNFVGYCDYCYDGEKNYDETGLDCGGPSCPACVKKITFFDWLLWLLILLWILLIILLILLWKREQEEKKKKPKKKRLIRKIIDAIKPISKRGEKVRERKIKKWFKKLFSLSYIKTIKRKDKIPVKVERSKEKLVSKIKRKLRQWKEKRRKRKTATKEKKRIKKVRREFNRKIKKTKKEVKKQIRKEKKRKIKGGLKKRKLANLMSKLKLWKRKGYYRTAKLETEIEKLRKS